MTQYRISHTYLTLDDTGHPVVETETATTDDVSAIAAIVSAMLDAPGGKSGTTVSLTVTPTSGSAITI